jgi:hypothetical protein
VHLTLTAPTDEAEVAVRDIVVFGKVDPTSSAVSVAGRHTHVVDGVFRQPMVLRRGVNHIKLVAREAGYAPATLEITVRSAGHRGPPAPTGSLLSSPRPNAARPVSPATTGLADSGFIRHADAICGSYKPPRRGEPRRTAEQTKTMFLALAQELRRLRPPPAERELFGDYLRDLGVEAGQMERLARDFERHDVADAKRERNYDDILASAADEIATNLGLDRC